MSTFDTYLVQTHAEFFFPDGNLVLVTVGDPAVAFRLHKGVVTRWFPAFRQMIDGLDSSCNSLIFLGCAVLVFDDDPVDLERLIRLFYDGGTVPLDCSPTNFPILASILKLSSKYGIPSLQRHTLSHLLAAYPLTLSEWDVREAYVFSPAARRDRLATLRAQRPHPLAVVNLALQINAPHLLIPAYLDLARFPVSDIIRGYKHHPSARVQSAEHDHDATTPVPSTSDTVPTLHLPTTQTTAVLRGKETLQRFIADFIKASVENRPQSHLCRYHHMHLPSNDPLAASSSYPCAAGFARVSHEMLVMTAGVAGGVDSDPLFVLKCAVEMLKSDVRTRPTVESSIPLDTIEAPDVPSFHPPHANSQTRKESRDGVCAGCTESFKNAVDAARQHIWNCLPKWFDLRKVIENGFEEGWE